MKASELATLIHIRIQEKGDQDIYITDAYGDPEPIEGIEFDRHANSFVIL
jgi:hypothetical protein